MSQEPASLKGATATGLAPLGRIERRLRWTFERDLLALCYMAAAPDLAITDRQNTVLVT